MKDKGAFTTGSDAYACRGRRALAAVSVRVRGSYLRPWYRANSDALPTRYICNNRLHYTMALQLQTNADGAVRSHYEFIRIYSFYSHCLHLWEGYKIFYKFRHVLS